MSRQTLFVDVIVPVPMRQTFTYRVPLDMNDEVAPGKRVVVAFGKKRNYTGLIRRVHENPPEVYKAKYIDAVLDESPIVYDWQFAFWEWMAHYYMCGIGEVMNAAIPSGLKLNSEQYLVKHPDSEVNYDELSDKEYLIAEAIEIQQRIKLDDVQAILGIKTIQPIVKSLIDKRVVVMEDELRARYKPKFETFVHLNSHYENEAALNDLLDKLQSNNRSVKQLEVLLAFLHFKEQVAPQRVVKRELLEFSGGSPSSLNTLIKKEVLVLEEDVVNRIQDMDNELNVIKALSEAQEKAKNEIKEGFDDNKPVLLHGVTSSGKTEIYVSLIQEVIDRGEQVLFMIPEIALTTQLIRRLQKYFGDRIGIFHSKFGQNERVEVWQRSMSEGDDRFDILVGARSSLFLPFRNLGLIIIDEEHENTFKQYDPAPRYHARDAAMVLAHEHQANVLMGTATPSIESYWLAEEGKYHLVEINKRYGDVKMPEILCADLKKEQREKTMHSHFSSFLVKQIEEAIEAKEQIILFQNRRGYTPMWVCNECGWVPQCVRCDVSLTYHKQAHLLNCHYCGYAIHPPRKCDSCGSTELEMKGFGTEKIEDEIKVIFPNISVSRLDLDTTRSKHSYQRIIESFSNREIDVLIGTQMVSKGLDFDNVSLVGVLSADQMLNYPDFRSFERAYQLMSQVAGRAGRNKKRGKVIIQTYQPDHWIIQQVIDSNYKKMYQQELFERKNFSYPPFFRMIQFTVKHRDKEMARRNAELLASKLTEVFKNRILGPQDPMVARINNLYIKQIILKLERELSNKKVRNIIWDILKDLESDKDFKSSRIMIDVDPT